MVDISEYSDDLTPINQILLREHLSKAYELAEILNWCNPSTDLKIHKRTISENNGDNNSKEAIVPIISETFEDHERAQNAYTELQTATNEINIDVYDVHYEKNKRSIGVVLDPFEL
jgi:hypothetical protein